MKWDPPRPMKFLLNVIRKYDIQRERRVVDEAYRFRGRSTLGLGKTIIRLEAAERSHRLGYEMARSTLQKDLAEATGDTKMAEARARELHILVERLERKELP